jgi:hypothetical protein
MIWPALLLAPLLALTEQSVAYALATPTCQTQAEHWHQLVPAPFIALTLLFTVMAWLEVRKLVAQGLDQPHVDADARDLRRYFAARLAVWCGGFSTLVIVAMWIPQWVLSPCSS